MTADADGDDSDASSEYEPEYEPESFTLGGYAVDADGCAGDDADGCGGGGATERTVPRYDFEVLSVVPPPIEYMSALHAEGCEISGRQVWCGSLLLCHHLLRSQSRREAMVVDGEGGGATGGSDGAASSSGEISFEGKRILELGAGTGLAGMLASKLSARCVAITDGDNEAVRLLCQNLANDANSIDGDVAKATKLLWGDDDEINAAFSDWCRRSWPHVWPLSSSAEEEEEEEGGPVEFDFVLAGDVMYKEELPPLFFASVNRFLSDRGEMFLCHIPRSTVGQEVILDAAEAAGFRIVRVEEDLADLPDGCPLEDARRAAVYRVTRKGPTCCSEGKRCRMASGRVMTK